MKVLVIGGTRYFGKRYVEVLLKNGHEVTVLSRGNLPDDFGDRVLRLHADRTKKDELKAVLHGKTFDVVTDQVCMTGKDAETLIELLHGRTKYLIMTSTMAVYPEMGNLRENDFPPGEFKETESVSYADGKRSAENIFSQNAPFPVSFARFPIVLGEDDYTLRLYHEVKKVQEGRPLNYPNPDALFSFITSEDAGKALLWLSEMKPEGAFNFSSADTIRIGELTSLIEIKTSKKAVISENAESSPFGIRNDFYMNVEKAASMGFKCRELSEWLESLITYYAQK